MTFATGYRQDEPDPRDFEFEPHKFLFGSDGAPSSYSEMASRFDVLLEQHAESCVGFACSEALYAGWKMQGIDKPLLASPLFIWWCSRLTHGDENENTGTFIRTALKQMRKLGFCSDEVYPGTDGADSLQYADKPSRLAFACAYDQRLTELEYYRIKGIGDARVASWKAALSSAHPIVFGVPVVAEFHDWDGVGVAPTPTWNSKITGGHAMCALGYDEGGVYGPQTWGERWGADGWFRLSWEYIEKWALDQWAIRTPQYFSEPS